MRAPVRIRLGPARRERDHPSAPSPTPRAWGLSPAEAYSVGTWDCTLSLNGADLPYGVVITMSDSGAYSVDIGGSGVLQNYSMTVADGDVLAFGEPGSPEGDLGKVARVEGFPAELPAPGESVTISRYPDGADSPDMQFTVSVDADVVHVENPTFGADAMDCRRA